MPAPTGSRGLPPAKAWQDWFTIWLRTWATVISPEFETELVKKVLGQPADLSRHGAADRQLAHEISFNIDDKMLPYLVRLRDPESVAQGNLCELGRAHGSTSREGCQACSLPRLNEAVVDVKTQAHRPQRVAGGGKVAIQRNSDATPEDGHGWCQKHQQRTRNHRLACAKQSRKAVLCHWTQSCRLGGDGRRLASQRQYGWSGKGCQR